MKQTFWDKNKVFILGALGSVALALQPFVGQADDSIKLKAVAFAILMAVLAYLAKEWRGQALSITGIIGNLAGVFVTLQEGHQFTWIQFILQGVLAIIAVAVPDPKSRGYEQSSAIKDAKREGEAINPAQLTAKPK